MEIYQLNSFIAVCETKNLTRAAGMMNISQSAMSSQIKALESELGITLFRRQAKGMQLTQKGEPLLKEAKRVVLAFKKMKQKALDLQQNISGELNIGINTDPRFLEISDIRKSMSRQMPGLNISFIESQTFETCKMLTNEKIDVGFHYGTITDISIYSLPLVEVVICVVIPSGIAENSEHADFETLVSLPWVWTRYGCPFHVAFEKELETRQLKLNRVADAVQENIVRELVKSGAGVALMRKAEAQELVLDGDAVIWKGLEMKIPLAVACLEKRRTEGIISEFFKNISEKYDTC